MQNKEKSITAIIKDNTVQVRVKDCNGPEVSLILAGIVSTIISTFKGTIPNAAMKKYILDNVMIGFNHSGMKITSEDLRELADTLEANSKGDIEGTA